MRPARNGPPHRPDGPDGCHFPESHPNPLKSNGRKPVQSHMSKRSCEQRTANREPSAAKSRTEHGEIANRARQSRTEQGNREQSFEACPAWGCWWLFGGQGNRTQRTSQASPRPSRREAEPKEPVPKCVGLPCRRRSTLACTPRISVGSHRLLITFDRLFFLTRAGRVCSRMVLVTRRAHHRRTAVG